MKILVLILSLLPTIASAERAFYGDVELTGMARDTWGQFAPGVTPAMVCEVNGKDGFLSVRSGPGSNYTINRNLLRLAILDVDTRHRQGHWIYVQTAYRAHTPYGAPLGEYQNLPVQGWVHDSYLCSFRF